jgi:Uma2 family endonuclease
MSTATQLFEFPNYPPLRRGEPVWPLARLYPAQGYWTEDSYFALNASFLVELSDGFLEFPPPPTIALQLIALSLAKLLDAYVSTQQAGMVLLAPLPVHLWPEHVREPDILFLRPGRPRYRDNYPQGVDLAMEVVSGGAEDRKRDLVTKREEYATAGIPEYWIVDPQEQRIIVLTLDGNTYREHGTFGPGQTATSVLLSGFSVEVSAVLAAGTGA